MLRKVSIVIPAKDEQDNIGLVLADLKKVTAQMDGYEFEVICVDDHSADRTGEIAGSYGARVIRNENSSGKGMALRKGFEAATGEVIVMMDADYSHRPEDLPALISALNNGAGLVIGSRIFGGSEEYTRVRALGNVLLTAALGFFLGRYLSDALNGYKAFKRDVFTDFKYTSKSFEIEIELIANALRKGYKIVEISSHERARHGGEAKSKVIRHGTRFLLRIIWEWMRNWRLPARPGLSVPQPSEPLVAHKAGQLTPPDNN